MTTLSRHCSSFTLVVKRWLKIHRSIISSFDAISDQTSSASIKYLGSISRGPKSKYWASTFGKSYFNFHLNLSSTSQYKLIHEIINESSLFGMMGLTGGRCLVDTLFDPSGLGPMQPTGQRLGLKCVQRSGYDFNSTG